MARPRHPSPADRAGDHGHDDGDHGDDHGDDDGYDDDDDDGDNIMFGNHWLTTSKSREQN